MPSYDHELRQFVFQGFNAFLIQFDICLAAKILCRAAKAMECAFSQAVGSQGQTIHIPEVR